MQTIGRVGARAALLVLLALALGVPAAGAQGLPPTGVAPVDDVLDDVGGLLPEPPPVTLPAPPALPAPGGAVPDLPAAPAVPPVDTAALVDRPAPGGLPGAGALPGLGAIPDLSGLPALCGLGSGVPDADVLDCVLITLLGPGGADILEPPDALCDLNGTLGGILDPVCPDDPGGPGNPSGPTDPGGIDLADVPPGTVEGATLARTGGGLATALAGLVLVTIGALVLRARRLVSPT